MGRRKKSSHAWVYMIWGMNGAALIAILIIAVLYTSSLRASAADGMISTAAPRAKHGKSRQPVISCQR